MSIWSQIGSSLIKGVGYTIGVKVGKDLYDAASDQLEKVVWEKLREDADGVVGKVTGVFRRDGEEGEPEGRDRRESEALDEEEFLLDPDLIDRTL